MAPTCPQPFVKADTMTPAPYRWAPLLLFSLLPLLTACRLPAPAQAQALRRLTVIEGSGGGSFRPGDTVRIEPYRMPDTKVFGGWEGAPAGSDEAQQAHASFAMPDRDLVLRARWEPAPLWSWEPVPGLDGAAIAHPPRLPAGFAGHPAILVLLHDEGQDLRYWQQSTEARLFARAAAARGMGLLALQSTDRVSGRWNVSATDLAANPDLAKLLQALHAVGFVGPLVFVGVGQGATFADLALHAFQPLSSVQAMGSVLADSAGGDAAWAEGRPRFWLLAAKGEAPVKAEAARRHALLRASGETTGLLEQGAWPMYPRRFWRVEGMTAADSQQFHRGLVDAGILDASGWVQRDPSLVDPRQFPADFQAAAPNLIEQLRVGWGGQALSSHAAEAMLNFAEVLAPLEQPLPTAEPTRLAYAGHVTVHGGAAGKGDFGGSEAWYADRDIVHLWAQPDPPGLRFERWTGNVESLVDPRARHSQFMVRSVSTRLDANFAVEPDWRPASRRVDGRDLYFHAPPDPVGLVFFFHGAGGGSQGWVQPSNAERWQALRDVVARGYAVAVTESGDRQAAQWSGEDPPEANPDIQHVKAFHAQLLAEGALPVGLPVFGIGMSNGGGFVSRVADALAWQGAVVYDAGCRARLAATTSVPLAWHLSENDRRISNQDAFACHQALLRRGIPSELHVLAPQPVHPMRLQRGPGIGPREAEQVRQTLTTAGFLDRLDYQTQPPSTSDWREALEDLGGLPQAQLAEQLDVCWTEHQFYGDFMHLALDFFDRQRGIEGTPTPRPAVTLTPGPGPSHMVPTDTPTVDPTTPTRRPSPTATWLDGGRRLWLPVLQGSP